MHAAAECIRSWVEDFSGDLATVTVPTLVIHGDSDGIVPLEVSGQRTAQPVAGTELHVVAGGPHGINGSHTEEFNRVLLEFPHAEHRPDRHHPRARPGPAPFSALAADWGVHPISGARNPSFRRWGTRNRRAQLRRGLTSGEPCGAASVAGAVSTPASLRCSAVIGAGAAVSGS